MRYRIGETPTEPVMSLDQGAFLAIAVLSLTIGAGFVFAGIRSKHYWMAIWGTGLTWTRPVPGYWVNDTVSLIP